WRYFRKLGKTRPEHYTQAVLPALRLYEDTDVATGLALLDNWGLVHILFHHSPALISLRNRWTLAEGHPLAELTPAPLYHHLWKTVPNSLFNLIKTARCRPVRQWAIQTVRRDHAGALTSLPPEELVGFLTSDDPEVVALAVDLLKKTPNLAALGVPRLLKLLE